MESRRTTSPALISVFALLLPLALYVGSYFALVEPVGSGYLNGKTIHYRYAYSQAEYLYWPLEQIDRSLRPRAWQEIHMSPPVYLEPESAP